MNESEVLAWRTKMDRDTHSMVAAMLGRSYFLNHFVPLSKKDRTKVEERLEYGAVNFRNEISREACHHALKLISQTGRWGW